MHVSTPSHLAYVGQLGLGVVFFFSVLPKLRRPPAFIQSVMEYRLLSSAVIRIIAPVLIGLEGFVALALLTGWSVDLALTIAAVLMLVFLLAVGVNLWRGAAVSCGCFGAASEPISRLTVGRLLALLVVDLLVLGYRSAGQPTVPSLAAMNADAATFKYLVAAASLSAFLVLSAVWLMHAADVVQVLRQLRLDQTPSAAAHLDKGGD